MTESKAINLKRPKELMLVIGNEHVLVTVQRLAFNKLYKFRRIFRFTFRVPQKTKIAKPS